MTHRIALTVTAAAMLAATLAAAANASIDTSMLQRWTPPAGQLAAADPVALAYLAQGWQIAGDTSRTNTIMRELHRRGELSYTAGILPNQMDWRINNPADTVYTVTLVQVADAYRATNDTPDLTAALDTLHQIPLVDGGGCYAYSVIDAPVGCVGDIGLIALAVLSRIPNENVDQLIRYEETQIRSDGSILYFPDVPESSPSHGSVLEAGHLAWSAWELLRSPNPRVRAIGLSIARYARAGTNTNSAPYAFFATAALNVLYGDCADAMTLPEWADAYNDPTHKTQQWAAFVYTWAQPFCTPSAHGRMIAA